MQAAQTKNTSAPADGPAKGTKRALSAVEAKKVRQYLDARHAALRRQLPADANGEVLVPVKDPPPVQVLLPGFTVRATDSRVSIAHGWIR